MDANAIGLVSVAVLALTQLVKWGGLPDKLGPFAVAILSLIGVAFWGWSEGTFSRATGFSYFTGWVLVTTTAAGVFGFSRSTPEAFAKFKGTGPGTGTGPTSGSLVAVLLAVALGFGAAGCRKPITIPTTIPTTIAATEENLQASVSKGLDILIATGELANTLSREESRAAAEGLVPAAADEPFDKAMLAYVAASRKARATLQQGIKSWADLKAALDPVMAEINRVIGVVNSFQSIRDRVSSWAAAFRKVFADFLEGISVAAGEAMFGGAR